MKETLIEKLGEHIPKEILRQMALPGKEIGLVHNFYDPKSLQSTGINKRVQFRKMIQRKTTSFNKLQTHKLGNIFH